MKFSKFDLHILIQLVQEYERAVMFRLGRIIDRKPKGPGITALLDYKLYSSFNRSFTNEWISSF